MLEPLPPAKPPSPLDPSAERDLVEALVGLSGVAWTPTEALALQTLIAGAGIQLHTLSPPEWRKLLLEAKPFCSELARAQSGDERAKARLLEWSDRTISRLAGSHFDGPGDADSEAAAQN
ncbi:MAG: hypothetical protein HZA54_03800 [Planctomycetes bacterium]|nr:hypothetical protein [Planctomycetota bacterium]